MNRLNDILEWHVSRKSRMFSGYGINCCDYDGQDWTTVMVSVDGEVSKSRVVQILRCLEKDLNELLPGDEKPNRLAFWVEDDSKNLYWAKSRRVRGSLSARHAAKQMEVVPGGTLEDGEKTRPATPQPEMEEATRRDIVHVEL
ncbi:hypothetical protein GGR52DRAFT_92022 [Hypoxylon sp. FL1284]|nr:hypothetical protein GGR52DRAFT_92022 [Hypoxylon sp. FL1284]